MSLPLFDELIEAPGAAPSFTLALPFSDRQRSRLRIVMEGGAAAGITLPRGTLLRDGQCLRASADGSLLRVTAAPEPVSEVRAEEAEALARAAYHLGNRHVWVQLGAGWLRYLQDPVLDRMLQQLGYVVHEQQAPFEPEAGAYAAEGGHHGHDHAH